MNNLKIKTLSQLIYLINLFFLELNDSYIFYILKIMFINF
jgi:hypothetical protein